MRRYRIHPVLGVARVGTADWESFYLGPQRPGQPPDPDFSPRDVHGRLRRQGIRFHLFEFDDDRPDAPPREVHVNGVVRRIEWQIRLVNRKAAARGGRILDSGSCPSAGSGWTFLPGLPGLGIPGGMLVDPTGKMTFVAGGGTTHLRGGVRQDDLGDGIVSATLFLEDGRSVTAEPAWVVAAPPRFAPGLRSPVTLYDRILDLAVRYHAARPEVFDPGTQRFLDTYLPSFTAEIAPILRSAEHAGWVTAAAAGRARWNFAALSRRPFRGTREPTPVNIFERIRPPGPARETDAGLMPMLQGDAGPGTWLSLTPTQYHVLSQWKSGRFVDDWQGDVPARKSKLTAAGLDRAALEDCVGAPLCPGFEVGPVLGDPRIYRPDDPFRIRLAESEDDPHGLLPGMATAALPLPWQAGLFHTRGFCWPSHRPLQVRTSVRSRRMLPWDRGIESSEDMLRLWPQLGIIAPCPDRPHVLLERDRLLP